MDTLTLLNEWIDSPVYEAGVLLYERFILPTPAGSQFMLSLLKTGDDDYNRQKLTLALTTLRDALTDHQAARQASYPAELIDALEGAKSLMDERTVLKERLRMKYDAGISEGEELKGWVYRILAIVDELGVIYGRKSFFDQHGYLPDSAQERPELERPELTQSELLNRRNTLRTYITRYETKLRQPHLTDEQQTSWSNKLEHYRTELYQVQQELNETSDHVALPD